MLNFLLYVITGFIAQLIDGTMGMAYGISCSTFLKVFVGIPSAVASAVVHCAEIPTTLVSGISHWKLKNVQKSLMLKLIIPGVIGGILGAYFITRIGDVLEPFIDVYLIIMGFTIFLKALKKKRETPREAGVYIYPLGLVGGFLDATGGGGWGPIVNSTLIAYGHDVKKSIGTVNSVEFIVTVVETTTFATLLVDFKSYLVIIFGLVVGGVIAAPLAAILCKKIAVKPLLGLVGMFIICLNVYNLIT